MGEGGDRIVEEHHAVARDDQVEAGARGRPAGGVGDLEARIFRPLAGAFARGGDQRFGKVDADDLGVGERGGQREAGRAGAAADVEDAGAVEPSGLGRRRGDQRIVDRRQRAIGAPPFLGPDVADPAAPLICFGHRALVAARGGNWNLPARGDLGRGRALRKPPMHSPAPPADTAAHRPGFREFVVLMAALMALNALAIDAMVPALPAIGEALGAATDNQRQLVISIYMLGFGTTQLVYGPLADRLRAQAGADRQPAPLHRLRDRLRAGGELHPAARRAARAGRGGGVDPGAGRRRSSATASRARRWRGSCRLVFIVFLLIPMLAPTFGQLTLLDRAAGAGSSSASPSSPARCWPGRCSGCPRRCTPKYRRPLSARAILGGGARDADQPPVARLHARLHADDGRADRLHQLDPADRVRRLPAARADRASSSPRWPGRWR